MSLSNFDSKPIENKTELLCGFEEACKPKKEWLIGSEHELFGVYTGEQSIGKALGYEHEYGIRWLFKKIEMMGWTPIVEGANTIELCRNNASITLEPGGQIELATRPFSNVSDLTISVNEYIDMLERLSDGCDIAWLGSGTRPWDTLSEIPWMPKQRYEIMREALTGSLAHEMMKRTATVQVSLDFSDAEDAKEKMKTTAGLVPLFTALYANSPVIDGQLNGYQSYRSHIWMNTDENRCGLLPFFFEEGNLFEQYTEWALDISVMFIERNGYKTINNISFRRFLNEGFEGIRATKEDWELHLSTLFPDVRLKRLIEVRACDSNRLDMMLALAPLCQSLLYDKTARDDANQLTEALSFQDRVDLIKEVSRQGMNARVGQYTVRDLLEQLLQIASDSLMRTNPQEISYLAPLKEVVMFGRTHADEIIALWNQTNGNKQALIKHLAIHQ